MKYLHILVLILILFVAVGCGGGDEEATPFVIQDPDTSTDSAEPAGDTGQPAEEPPPPTETPVPPTEPPPTETPTATPTPTSTLEIATVPADETPLAPGINTTPDITNPDIMATIGPILTAFPDLNPGDIDLDALPELPGGIELPDLPLPPLPGG